ncbi:uncharacterized protein V6R79_023488 [Siganus canaliculatus]
MYLVKVKGLKVDRVVVEEGSDVVLRCSPGNQDLKSTVFDWRKEVPNNRQEVFFYAAGVHYNNGRTGQDPQFKGRVSHFEDELQHGNASIKIHNTKMEDSGDYSCYFPRLDQIFYVQLVVGAPRPYIKTVNATNDWTQLQCDVRGASTKPKVEWKNSDGKVLHSQEPEVTQSRGRFDITLLITVNQTGLYRCVVTQEELHHQTHEETFVSISGSENPWQERLVSGVVGFLIGWLTFALPVGVIIFVAPQKIVAFVKRFRPAEGFICVSGLKVVRVFVEEGSDAVLRCFLRNQDLKSVIFDWRKVDHKDLKKVFLYDAGKIYNDSHSGQDPQFKGRVSHFGDELQRGNASIKIHETTVEDGGSYTCCFPFLDPPQSFHAELVVGASDGRLLSSSPPEVCHGQPLASNRKTVERQEEKLLLLLLLLVCKCPWITMFLISAFLRVALLLCLCRTSFAENGLTVDTLSVREGSDVVLPCSPGNQSLRSAVFEWKKHAQRVFLYYGGKHYNNGQEGQDPQFKGRVSYFGDGLQHGNASIKILNAKVEDSGIYTCYFDRLDQTFYVKLVVGVAATPCIKTVNATKDWTLLQCDVRGSSPEPKVEWKNSDGKVLHSQKPQVTESEGRFNVTLLITVNQTERYRCVVTQEELHHQDHEETFVYISSENPWWGWFILALVIGAVTAFAALWILAVLKNRCRGSARSKADSKGDGEAVPLTTKGLKVVRVIVGEGSDVVLPCFLRNQDLTGKVFDWRKGGQMFLHDENIENGGHSGRDLQFKDRVSHFGGDLQHGNASIKICNTKMEDSGDYSCHCSGQTFYVKLEVGGSNG